MDLRATSSNPDRNGEASSGAPAREATHIQAESSAELRPICHRMSRCDGLRPFLPGSSWSRCWSSACGRPAATARRSAISTSRTAKRELAGAPAPLAALHEQSAELLPGGPKAFRKRLASAQGLPRRRQQVGLVVRPVPHRVPDLPAAGRDPGQEGRVHRRQRRRFDRAPPRRFLSADAAAVPVLPRPGRGHREDDQGAGELPDHRVLRPPWQARLRAPGRLPARIRPRRRHAALPLLMAVEVRRPRDEHELAAALALREEVFVRRAGRQRRRRPRRPRPRGAAARGGRGRASSAPAGC